MASFEHPFRYGDKVKFSIAVETKLELVRNCWQYSVVKSQAYVGTIVEVRQHQLTVEVKKHGLCRIHPDMAQFNNTAMSKLER